MLGKTKKTTVFFSMAETAVPLQAAVLDLGHQRGKAPEGVRLGAAGGNCQVLGGQGQGEDVEKDGGHVGHALNLRVAGCFDVFGVGNLAI